MDAIEKAIRNALQKGPATDRVFREKVYRQAFSALERALQANPSVTVETAIRRRKGLQTKITEIESEFLPPLPPGLDEIDEEFITPADFDMVEADEVEPDTRVMSSTVGQTITVEPVDVTIANAPGPTVEVIERRAPRSGTAMPVAPQIHVETSGGPTPEVPDIMLETRPAQREPADSLPLAGATTVDADRDSRRAERRRPFAAAFFAITLLCLAAIGVWWAIQTGLINPPSQEITGIEQPAAPVDEFEPGAEGAPALPGEADLQRNWVAIFSPADPSTVNAPGDAKAEVMTETDSEFMRIRSGTSGSALIFDIGQGVLEQIAGKKATFDIVARAEDGKETQMSVACNFAELGDCGRKRYAVSATRADYLFEIDMPAATPGAGGTIAINSDFANSGKAVDIFEIKVSVAP